jgi:glycosyltransferase involved in cell wall biosynthesis
MKKRIVFLFNQMLTANFGSGGDVLGKKMVDCFMKDPDFDVSIIIPKVCRDSFPKDKTHLLSIGPFERYLFKFSNIPSIFFLYLERTYYALKSILSLKADIIYTTGDFFCNVIPAYIYKKVNKVKWVACVYHINPSPFSRKNSFLRSFVSYCMQRFSLVLIRNSADAIFVLNKEVKNNLIVQGFKNKIIVSGAGLDIYQMQRELGTLNEVKYNQRLVFFNRLNLTKGVFDLPEILSNVLQVHPECKLDIIGSADETTLHKLKEKFKEFGCLDEVCFHGFVKEKKDVLKLILGAKVFIQPSYEEGWSIVLFEGIMCNRIPVTYDLPIYREVFGDLVKSAPVGEITAFSKLVLEVLAYSNERYLKESAGLYSIAVKYDWKDVYKIKREAICDLT